MRIVAPIPKICQKNKLFIARQFYTLHEQNFSNLRPFLFKKFPQGYQKSKKFGQWTLLNGGKKTFKQSEQMKKIWKNFFCRGNFKPFISKSFQIWDHFFPLFFTEDSENIKSVDIGFQQVGGKKTVKRSEKHRYQKIQLGKAKFAQKLNYFARQLYTPYK